MAKLEILVYPDERLRQVSQSVKAIDNKIVSFISDLEDACQAGNYKKMEYEAARLQSVSENGLSGLEGLIELGLQDLDYFGLFC